ncbi:hypothetical protein [Sorangium sp. So ce145]|uniref:hypothetical protein n=1 Tax=Sorangium sp. So ce145 TaxID=3133285 RepID=UPI003F6463FA
MEFCARRLGERSDPKERSDLLWTLANVARRMGAMDSASEAAEQKLAVDRARGDERAAALAMSCRADILQARGQLDGALRIRREDELPVYERLGATRDILVARVEIALNLLARNTPGDRGDATALLDLAYSAAVDLRIPEADQIRRIQKHYRLPT